MLEKKIEISEDTLRGLFLILCGVSHNHSMSEVYTKAVPIMNKAHQEILDLGHSLGFDNRGADL